MFSSSSIGAFDYQTVGHTVFAVGRFLSALAGLLVEPRWILMSLYLGSLVTSILAMNLTGYAGVAMVILIMLFEVRFACIVSFKPADEMYSVGYLFDRLCYVHPWTWLPHQNRVCIAYSLDLGRGHNSSNHVSSGQKSQHTVRNFGHCCHVRIRDAPSSLYNRCTGCKEADQYNPS